MTHAVETLQSIYQAFGRGDLPAILAVLSPNVQWERWRANSLQESGHPLFAARDGRDAAAGFFQVLAQQATLHSFEVLDIVGSGRQAVAECSIDFTWNATGQRVQDEELHLWTFGDDGLVTRFRHYTDTAKHLRAAGLT